jgi:hypothetical protein
MEGWQPGRRPGFGWPLGERSWINPSPNAPNLSMARCYAGTVMLEGTTLSEGRGTTRPLELFGAPDIDARAGDRRDAAARARTGCGLPAARMLVRADLPQARRQAVRRRADPCRRSGPATTTPPSALAPAGAGLQGDPQPAARLPAVARFPLRIRARPPGHRSDQRPGRPRRPRRRAGDATSADSISMVPRRWPETFSTSSMRPMIQK